jgi:hypothetical protein
MSEQVGAFEPRRSIVEGLGWGGILPFLILPLASGFGLGSTLETLLVTYGLLILAFLCGTMWMEQLLGPAPSNGRIIASNVILLAAWPAVVLPLSGATSLLAVAFLAHLLLDRPWAKASLPPWYGLLRLRLSLVVITVLVATLLVQVADVF